MTHKQSSQADLLHAIFRNDKTGQFNSAGLAVYRRNLIATATQALTITYPTIAILIGKDMMRHGAMELLQRFPPHQGNWALWGAQLADILADNQALKNFPFVVESARLDFLCHQLVREADNNFDLATLNLLQEREPDDIRIELNPLMKMIPSTYELDELWALQKTPDDAQQLAVEKIMDTVDQQQSYIFQVHRPAYAVEISRISAIHYQWQVLLQTHSLGKALEEMADSQFDFESWLLHAVRNNLLSNISTI